MSTTTSTTIAYVPDGEFAVENISAVAGGIHVGLEFWEPELPPLVMCKGELTIKPADTTVAS